MEYLRKLASKRVQEIRAQKNQPTNNTKVNNPKPRRRTDEIYADMMDRVYDDIESKMIDLSRWNGEGPLYKYRELID